MYQLTIQPPAGPALRPGRPAPKTRRFAAYALAWITGRELWPDPTVTTDHIRPLWLLLTAGEEATLRPFLANLRAGRPADLTESTAPHRYDTRPPPRMELLKSAGYSALWQRGCGADRASVTTLYQPALTALDPGLIDPTGVRFLCLPPVWWVAREAAALRTDSAQCHALVQHGRALGICDSQRAPSDRRLPVPLTLSAADLLDLAPQAAYFAAYLDRRTARPLINDLAFAVQLYLAALLAGVASRSQTRTSLQQHHDHWRAQEPDPADPWWWARHAAYHDFVEVETATVGLLPGIACATDQATLDRLLATEVQRYLQTQAALVAGAAD